MEVRGNLDTQLNRLLQVIVDPVSGSFPIAKVGRIVYRTDLKNLFLCTDEIAPIWIPVANLSSLYAHTQTIPTNMWIVDHNLGSTNVFVQVYDSNNYQVIPGEIRVISANRVIVDFSTSEIGKVLVAVLGASGVGQAEGTMSEYWSESGSVPDVTPTCTAPHSIAIGNENTITHPLSNIHCFIGGGWANNIVASSENFQVEFENDDRFMCNAIAAGYMNRIENGFCSFVAGENNRIIPTTYNTYFELTQPTWFYTNFWNSMLGGLNNTIDSSFVCLIGGGSGNSIIYNTDYLIDPYYSSILNGDGCLISGSTCSSIINGEENENVFANYAFTGSGQLNIITNGNYEFIGTGLLNKITNCAFTSILNGERNEIIDSFYALIGSGRNNHINNGCLYSGILQGEENTVNSNSNWSHILGGMHNNVENGNLSVISGGAYNSARSGYTFIGSGWGNDINAGAPWSVIGGGWGNTIKTQSEYSFVGSGQHNTIEQDCFFSGFLTGSRTKITLYGEHAHSVGGFNDVFGSAQKSEVLLRRNTQNGTSAPLYLDGVTRKIKIENDISAIIIMELIAFSQSGLVKSFLLKGSIKKIGIGDLQIVQTFTKEVISADVGTTAWDVSVSAVAPDILDVNVIGSTESINWNCCCKIIKVIKP